MIRREDVEIHAIRNDMATLAKAWKSTTHLPGDMLTATDDRIAAVQPAFNGAAIQLRKPVRLHVQHNCDVRIERLNNGSELGKILDVNNVTCLRTEVPSHFQS